MKIALISDIHLGARNDSPVFLEHFNRFFNDQFFPYLEKHGVRNIFILGDILDRRKYINIHTSNFIRTKIFQRLGEFNVYIVAGNHDVYHSNTLSVNSLDEIVTSWCKSLKFAVFTEPTEMKFTWGKVLFLPWICDENREQSLKVLKETDAEIVFAHLQLQGFEMHKGHVSENGMEPSLFKKFKTVITGHFHHKSSRGNIHYLGAPYEITWADYDDPRGFHLFDTDTLGLHYIPNSRCHYYKLLYDDSQASGPEAVLGWDYEKFKNCYIKVIVKHKKNPYWFDQFIDALDKQAEDVKIIEMTNRELSDVQIDEKVENTPAILKKYGEEAEFAGDKTKLVNLLINLYAEALSQE